MKECDGRGIEPVNVWLPSGHASDRASGPGLHMCILAADFYNLRREDAQYSSHDILLD